MTGESTLRPSRAGRLILTLALGVVLVGGGYAKAAGKPSNTCPPGFDLGALTLEEALDLPRVQAGLAAGAYDEAFVVETFLSFDANEDGLVCHQDTFGIAGERPNPASQWQYLYNLVDNNASNP